MVFLRKNPVFCAIVAVCVLIFAAGCYLLFAESGQVKKAKRLFSSNEMQLKNLLHSDPAPTESNLLSAEENIARLAAALETIRDDLQQGARLTVSTDSIGVMAAVQQYISDFQRMAEDHVDGEGEPAPVAIAEDFAFGFERYLDDTEMFDDAGKAALLDKQRQILAYLSTQLIESNPQRIREIERETIELESNEGYTIDPAVSARVPDAIETMAFRLTFDGYTDSLRRFLNRLAAFDLPIVVRGISVNRPAGKQTVVAPTPGDELDDIFGVFGGASSTASGASEPVESQKPVIEENISTFTVILEFIEVVLPEAVTKEEGSDPA
jgi:hypothetical protein